jgi:spore coat protein U-like protein
MSPSIHARLSKPVFWSLSCVALGCALLSPSVQAAIACTGLSATSVSGTTPVSGNLDLVGTMNFTCTRLTTDATNQTIFLGVNIGENPDGSATTGTDREMTRQTGTQQVNYSIFRNAGYTGAWTSGTGRALNNTNIGGLQTAITFSSASTTAQNFSFPYYLRVTQANWGAAAALAGIYDDVGLLATLRLNNTNGPIQSTAAFGVTMSKPKHCYFSSSPTNVALTYTAFAATAQNGASNFSVNCTAPTTYTMTLDSTSGVLVGLRYNLALSNSGTIVGNGFQQNHSVTVTLPAGQAGNCSGANCNGSRAHTITITY